jgi:hypothetical protein
MKTTSTTHTGFEIDLIQTMYQIGRSISVPCSSTGGWTGGHHPCSLNCKNSTRNGGYTSSSSRTPSLLRQNRVSRVERTIPDALVSPNVVFDAVTVGVMPLYALMMWFPRSQLTRKLMGSNMRIFLGGSILYAYMLLSYGGYEIFRPLVESIRAHGLSSDCAARYLAIMASMLEDTKVTALTWVHLLLMDLFQAKWVYEDALHHNVSCIHSLILCFMVGPIGLLSHMLTKALKQTYA